MHSSSQLKEFGPISEMDYIFLVFLKKELVSTNCSEKSILWSQKLTERERHKIINASKKSSKIIWCHIFFKLYESWNDKFRDGLKRNHLLCQFFYLMDYKIAIFAHIWWTLNTEEYFRNSGRIEHHSKSLRK